MNPLNGYEASQLDDGLKEYEVQVDFVPRVYGVVANSEEEALDAAREAAAADLDMGRVIGL